MKKKLISDSTKYKLFLFSEVIFMAVIAFIVGAFVFSFTRDLFWKYYTYLVHLVLIVGIIFLQLYNYLYFISSMVISLIIMGLLLLYKLSLYDNLGFRSFIKSDISTYILIWLLFIISFLTVLMSIGKYITSLYTRNNLEPTPGIKGPIGNRGPKGPSYQLKPFSSDGEAEYIYNAMADHANKYFTEWKIQQYKKYERQHKKLPTYLIFNKNEPQLNNLELLNIFKRICNSVEFKKKLNSLTNSMIEKDDVCIKINNKQLTFKELESLLNKYLNDNKRLLEEHFDKPFTILDSYSFKLHVYEDKQDFDLLQNKFIDKIFIKTVDLPSGEYIYKKNKCSKGMCNPSNYINIYDMLVKDMGDGGFSVDIIIEKQSISFKNKRNLALNEMKNYMNIFTMNWIDLMLKNPKGYRYLSELIITNNLIKDTIDILDDSSILMLLFMKTKHGYEYMIPIRESVLDLRDYENNIQTGFMLLRDIDIEIGVNNLKKRYSFIKTQGLTQLYSVELKNGIYHIDKQNQIQSIKILKINNRKSPWNWGSKDLKCKQ